MAKLFLLVGSINAGLCIVLGAFAAHKLKEVLTDKALATFQTGVQYHFYHAVALVMLGLIILQLGSSPLLRYAGYTFILGIIFFSGSLYGLSFELGKWLGPITPLGGFCFIIAWAMMAIAISKSL